MRFEPLPDLERLALHTAHGPVEIDTSLTLRRVSTSMVRQARRGLRMVSRHLDPAIYDTPEFVDAVAQLVLNHRRAFVQVLVKDPTPVIRGGHGLLRLSRRLSSFIEIRVPAPEHAAYNAAFMVVDDVGVIWRRLADRYEAKADFADIKLARELVDTFEKMWSVSRTHADLREMKL